MYVKQLNRGRPAERERLSRQAQLTNESFQRNHSLFFRPASNLRASQRSTRSLMPGTNSPLMWRCGSRQLSGCFHFCLSSSIGCVCANDEARQSPVLLETHQAHLQPLHCCLLRADLTVKLCGSRYEVNPTANPIVALMNASFTPIRRHLFFQSPTSYSAGASKSNRQNSERQDEWGAKTEVAPHIGLGLNRFLGALTKDPFLKLG